MAGGLSNLSPGRKAAAMAGFLILGASPTYLEWQQQPSKRKQIVIYYTFAGALFYYGFFS